MNFGTFFAAMSISCPVCGLRPFLAARFEMLKAPNPASVTFCCCFQGLGYRVQNTIYRRFRLLPGSKDLRHLIDQIRSVHFSLPFIIAFGNFINQAASHISHGADNFQREFFSRIRKNASEACTPAGPWPISPLWTSMSRSQTGSPHSAIQGLGHGDLKLALAREAYRVLGMRPERIFWSRSGEMVSPKSFFRKGTRASGSVSMSLEERLFGQGVIGRINPELQAEVKAGGRFA